MMKLSNGRNIIKVLFGEKNRKNWLQKSLCLLMVVAMAMVASPVDLGALHALAGNEGYEVAFITEPITENNDLGKFIVDSKLKQDDKEIEAGGTVVVGEHYKYDVTFAEGTGKFTSPMYFQLPENIDWDIVTNVPLYDNDRSAYPDAVGWYSVDENGLVTFEFDEKYLENKTNIQMGLTLDLTVADTGDDGKITFPWKGSGSETFKTDPNPEAKLTKTAGAYNPSDLDGPCIDYTVELEITKGAIKNPQITDTMPSGMSYREGSGEVIVLDDAGNDITDSFNPRPTLQKTDEGWKVVDLPEPLSKGQKVVVTYKSDIDFTKVKNGNVANGNFSVSVDNIARFTGESLVTSGKDVDETDDAHKDIEDERVTKSGKRIEGENRIDWEIVVGSGSTDVRGAKVTDTLKGNQWIDPDTPLELKWKDENGNTIRTYKIPWDKVESYGLKPTYGEGDMADKIVGFEFTVPTEGSAPDGQTFWDGSDIDPNRKWEQGDQLKIEYYTEYDSNSSGQYENTATVDVNGNTFVDKDNVGIGAGTISKNGELSEDGEYMKYTVNVSIPSAADLAGATGGLTSHDLCRFYLEDQLEFADIELEDEEGNKRTVRYFVMNIPEIESIIVTPEGESPIEFTKGDGENQYQILIGGKDYTNSDEKDPRKTAREFRIVFNRCLTDGYSKNPDNFEFDKNDSYWEINKPCTLTITYKVKTSSGLYLEDTQYSNNIIETDLTVRDLLKQGHTLTNEITGYGRNDTNSFSSKHKYTEPKPALGVTKDAEILNGESDELSDNVIEYRVEFNGFTTDIETGKYGLYAIDPNEFYLLDTYDSRLEYVEGSLRIEVYAPDTNRHRYTFSYQDQPEINVGDKITTLKAYAGKFNYRTYQGDTSENGDQRTSLSDYMTNSDGTAKARDALYVFVYQLRVKDECLNGEPLELNNTATVYYGGEPKSDSARVDFTPDILNKNGIPGVDEEREIVKYTIEVNPGAADMVTTERQDLNPERFTLTDKMSEILELDLESVKVYRIEKNGVRTLLNSTTDQSLVKSDANYYVLQEAENNTFKLILPDKQHIWIEYVAKVNAEHDEKVTATNEVTMESDISITDTSKAEFRVDGNKGWIKGDAKLRLYKQDATTGNRIDGAIFDLYSTTSTGSGSEDIIITIGGAGYYLKLYKNNLNPTAEKGYEVGPENGSEAKYYVLIETKAPNGYLLNKEPIIIVFGERGDGPKTIDVEYNETSYEDLVIHYIVKGNNVITVDNQPSSFELPETGGSGTELLYVLGGVFLTFGCMILSYRKRLCAKRH